MLSTTGIFFSTSEPMLRKLLNSLTIVYMSSTTLPLQVKEAGIFTC